MKKVLIISILLCTIIACSEEKQEPKHYFDSQGNNNDTYQYDDNNSDDSEFEDGTYSATVEYYNPDTDYQATYTLDVDVENGQIVTIHFPNDGYLDESHIDPADIDESGHASIVDDIGREFEIDIDN